VDKLRIDVLDSTRWDRYDFPATMRVIVKGEVVEETVLEGPPAS
jgi:hypothetical protein